METVIVRNADTPLGQYYRTRPLLDAYTPLLYLAIRMSQDARPGASPEDFRRQMERELAMARQSASTQGVPESEISDAEFAVVATLNEIVRSAGGGLRSVWDAMPLQPRSKMAGLAGHDFYGALDRVDREGRSGPQSVFLLCLLAGFQGQLARDSRDRERRKLSLSARLTDRDADEALAPPVRVPKREAVQRAVQTPTRALAGLAGAGIALLSAVTLIWIWMWADRLAAELSTPGVVVRGSEG